MGSFIYKIDEVDERSIIEDFTSALKYGDHELKIVFEYDIAYGCILVCCKSCGSYTLTMISFRVTVDTKEEYITEIEKRIQRLIASFKRLKNESCELVKVESVMES